MNVLTTENITKEYGKSLVLEDINIKIKKGHICGLIGPNGAGKTTLMKILAGMIYQTSGKIEFFDSDKLDSQRKRISFMIELPIIDPKMNASDNLNYVRNVRGYPDEKRVDEVLDIVGLLDTGKKRVENFSLGMRQRLAIGMALLSKPEFLVLDEPVNGLDPEGIVEIRNVLKSINKEYNTTILISSHLLSELSEICTNYIIVNHGRIIESLSLEELTEKCNNHLCLKTNDIDCTAVILEDKLSIQNYKVIQSNEIHIYEQLDNVEKISKTITDNGLIITKLCSEGQKLEEYYLNKVGNLR